jgi:hypothetical protein
VTPDAVVAAIDAAARAESIELVAREDGLMLVSGGRELPLQELEDDLFLAPDAAFDPFPFHVERPLNGVAQLWHGGRRYVRAGAEPAPDGFDDQQPLMASPNGSFRVGEDPRNPESLRFDTVLGGRALRAWLSGWPYYRVD